MQMALKQQISEHMKDAMRAKDAQRLSVIRLLLAAIKQREIDERIELPDPEIMLVIEKMLKQRADSISQFTSAGRQDLADKEIFEVSVLQSYLPQPLSENELLQEIHEAIRTSGASTMRDMGKVMAALKPRIAGRADIAKVSALVKARLNG